MMSNTGQDYKIDFCPDMTMSYEDRHGLLKFVFEVASERRPKTLFLYDGAVDDRLKDVLKTPDNAMRIEQAFQRVISYLKSLDYDVEIIEQL